MSGAAHPHPTSRRRRIRQRLVQLLRLVRPSRLPMRGPYATFAAAMAEATGYDNPLVTEMVEEATRAVLQGRATYERDGTNFSTRPKLPIYDMLQLVMNENTTIADFGGGLGSLFINAPEKFPAACRQIVIEQASMVETGRRLVQEYHLPMEFLDAGEKSLPAVDVLVFSSVLQYLPDPWEVVDRLIRETRPNAVVLDRTTVCDGPSRWYVQTNPGYYREPISYPVQVLNRERLLDAFPSYRPVRWWHNDFDPARPEYIGMLLLRNNDEGSAA